VGRIIVSETYRESDGDLAVLSGSSLAVVGYGNQGRSWSLNLRDSGFDVRVCVRKDETRARAESEGFQTADIAAASDADVLCILVSDDVIPELPITRREDTPTSQYGQLSRRRQFDALDFAPRMKEIVEGIASGRFADEWDDESRSGHERLAKLKDQHCGEAIKTMEKEMRTRLGPKVKP
jgi:ketol-acid reductoisomerase